MLQKIIAEVFHYFHALFVKDITSCMVGVHLISMT